MEIKFNFLLPLYANTFPIKVQENISNCLFICFLLIKPSSKNNRANPFPSWDFCLSARGVKYIANKTRENVLIFTRSFPEVSKEKYSFSQEDRLSSEIQLSNAKERFECDYVLTARGRVGVGSPTAAGRGGSTFYMRCKPNSHCWTALWSVCTSNA